MSTVMALQDLPRRHRITVEEYHRMAEVGLLAPDARVELIEGEIIDMAPIGNPHRATVMMLDDLLHRAVGQRGIVLCQSSIRLGPHSEPEPDLAVLRARADYYRSAAPTAADALLVIEVSDTTWGYDRHTKIPLYARHGIPEVWLIDVSRLMIHVFREPSAEGFTEEACAESPGLTTVPGLPGVTVELSTVFPAG